MFTFNAFKLTSIIFQTFKSYVIGDPVLDKILKESQDIPLNPFIQILGESLPENKILSKKSSLIEKIQTF